MINAELLLKQLKTFVDKTGPKIFDRALKPILGTEFATQLEIQKNETVKTFLIQNSQVESNLADLNRQTLMRMEYGEKRVTHQQLLDLSKALQEALDEEITNSSEIREMLADFSHLIEEPTKFLQSFLRLRDETREIEERLTLDLSLPCLDEIKMVASAARLLGSKTEMTSPNKLFLKVLSKNGNHAVKTDLSLNMTQALSLRLSQVPPTEVTKISSTDLSEVLSPDRSIDNAPRLTLGLFENVPATKRSTLSTTRSVSERQDLSLQRKMESDNPLNSGEKQKLPSAKPPVNSTLRIDYLAGLEPEAK